MVVVVEMMTAVCMRSDLLITVRKRSCGKVMFSQACVKNSVSGGLAWQKGHVLQGGMCGRGGGTHGRGRVHGGGGAWGCAWQGYAWHVWQGVHAW